MPAMDLEIIIFAIIAAIVLGRLWMVLGRRNDDERQRPNPFAMPFVKPKSDDTAPKLPGRDAPFTPPLLKAAPESLAGGLEQIKNRDATFDEKQFLQTARNNFTMIVEDFAKGDLSRIAPLLDPAVLAHFQKALDARRASGQSYESKIIAITEAETASAKLSGDTATIAVHFVSNQENILRDAAGQIIGGEAGKIEEVDDVWTFARDMKLLNSNWLLTATGS